MLERFQKEEDPKGEAKPRWRDYISYLAWEHLGILPMELVEVARERVVWASLLKMLCLINPIN